MTAELRTSTIQEELPALHPSLVSFLHSPLASPALKDPAHVELPDIPQVADIEQVPVLETRESHFILVAPVGTFPNTVIQVLRAIDPECHVSQAPDLASVSPADLSSATLTLIDVDQAGTDPQSLVQALSAVTSSPIIVISAGKDAEAIDQALRAGAVGYLPKAYPKPLIEAVLRLIKSGERFRPNGGEAESRKRGRPPKSAQPADEALSALAGLTPRQKDVLLELARGASNLDISRRLNMREGTVKTHLFTIYRKLGVTNRAQAALYGMRMSELQQEQMVEAEKGKLDLSWLQPEMSHRKIRAGQWIFHQGDMGSELFYVQRGRVAFPEIGESVGAGEVFGEIGIFSPGHKRTCSARCETDVDLFTLSSGQVRRIYFGNPQFALFILTLVATRLADVRSGGATRAV